MAAGHVYVAHDWMADPTGFSFFLEEETGRSRRLGLPQPAAVMGDNWFPPARPGAGLVARFPLECRIRLLRDWEEIAVTEALKFIREKAQAKKPFFAVIWYGTPHSPWRAEEADKKPFHKLNAVSQEHYGELVAMDRSIGTLRKSLRDLEIEQNTLLWFTS